MSSLKIAPLVAELCIAHRQRGLARVYDQHRFDDEKREAFTAWEERLLSIVSPPADNNVVPLRQAT